MLGVLRTTLALMVMVYHLFVQLLPMGTYAVFGFYIISGYLMTLIMHESYGYTWFGRYSFAVNRFLRLYPQYWAAAILSVLLILNVGPEAVAHYRGSMVLPASYKGYISNLLMIFPSWYPNSVKPRLVPPTWALTVEIVFYVLICLGISKSFIRVKIWFLLSIGYVVVTFIAGLPSNNRYFPAAAASLPFSIGSGVFFMSKDSRIYDLYLKLKVSSAALFILMIAHCLVWVVLSKRRIGGLVEIGFYMNIVICTVLVYSVVSGGKIGKINQSIDKFIGDFSYPIYLLHWQSGLLASLAIFGEGLHGFSIRGFISLAVSIPIVCMLSFASMLVIDKPIQRIRAKIKTNKRLHGIGDKRFPVSASIESVEEVLKA